MIIAIDKVSAKAFNITSIISNNAESFKLGSRNLNIFFYNIHLNGLNFEK